MEGTVRGTYRTTGWRQQEYDGADHGPKLTVAEKDLFDYTFAIIRSAKDSSFKVDSDGNPTEDTFFYAGVVKTFDLFSN